jgi:hypothetical protein
MELLQTEQLLLQMELVIVRQRKVGVLFSVITPVPVTGWVCPLQSWTC